MLKFISLALLLLTSLTLADIRISTYNIRNFNYDERYDIETDLPQLKKSIKDLNSDIIGIQEIINAQLFNDYIKKSFKNYKVMLTKCGGQNNQKLGVVYDAAKVTLIEFEENFEIVRPGQEINSQNCNQGSRPFAIAKFKTKSGERINVIVVHLKSGGSQRALSKRYAQLNIIKKYILKNKMQDDTIILGDFNTTEYLFHGAYYKRFNSMMSELKMSSVSKSLSCSSYWWGGYEDGMEYPSILDHIVLPRTLNSKVDSLKVELGGHCKKTRCLPTETEKLDMYYHGVSDHCPITVTLPTVSNSRQRTRIFNK